ncbi:hypothetical protein COCVIDRAFT_53011, partial [Bipolaris victoriae FI3]
MSVLPFPPFNFGNSVTSPCSPPKACFPLHLRAPKVPFRPTPCLGSLGNRPAQEALL